jgi:hypothetical protein
LDITRIDSTVWSSDITTTTFGRVAGVAPSLGAALPPIAAAASKNAAFALTTIEATEGR